VDQAGREFPGVEKSHLLRRRYFLRDGVARLMLNVWQRRVLFQRCFLLKFLVVS
jgi:hypothetical protein